MKRLIILILIVLFNLTYCTLNLPEDPKPPKWDVEIERIPFLKAETLRVGDQLSAEDFQRMGKDSILSLNISDMKGIDLQDKLKIPSQSHQFTSQIGDFEVISNISQTIDVQFGDLFPDYTGFIGTNAVVPPVPLPTIDKAVSYADYVEMTIKSGQISFDVQNHLGFAFGDSIVFQLIDISSGERLIASLPLLEKIENGSTGHYILDLAGKTISSNLIVRMNGRLNGSDGKKVFIPNTSGVTVNITLEHIVANQAVARIPAQSFDLSGTVDINSDSLRLRRADIENGYLEITASNPFDFSIFIQLSIPNLTHENGGTVEVSLALPPKQQQVERIRLDKTAIDLDQTDLNFEFTLSIQPSSASLYTLNSTDQLVFNIFVTDIQLKQVTADFNLGYTFPEIEEILFDDPPKELNNIQFHDIIVKLSMPNSPFDTDLNITFQAIKNGKIENLKIQKLVKRGESLILSKDGINYDGSRPTIIDILNMMPEELHIFGETRVIGNNITIDAKDRIDVKYEITFPMTFSLSQASYSDIDSLILKDDVRKEIRENEFSGRIDMTVQNGIPISGTLSLLVGPDSTHVTTELFSLSLPTPKLSNGLVSEPGVGNLIAEVNANQLKAIADAYFFKYQISLNDVEMATLTADEYLIVKNVYISGKYLVNFE